MISIYLHHRMDMSALWRLMDQDDQMKLYSLHKIFWDHTCKENSFPLHFQNFVALLFEIQKCGGFENRNWKDICALTCHATTSKGECSRSASYRSPINLWYNFQCSFLSSKKALGRLILRKCYWYVFQNLDLNSGESDLNVNYLSRKLWSYTSWKARYRSKIQGKQTLQLMKICTLPLIWRGKPSTDQENTRKRRYRSHPKDGLDQVFGSKTKIQSSCKMEFPNFSILVETQGTDQNVKKDYFFGSFPIF